MDVNKNRIYDQVIVLGSGISILDLNKDEIKYINKCKKVIALNKFMAFYKKSGILPTHIYFHDFFGINFFKYILEICEKNNLNGLTIYTNPFFDNLIYTHNLQLPLKIFKDFLFRLKAISLLIIFFFKKDKYLERQLLFRKFNFFKLNICPKIISFNVKESTSKMKWASSFDENIFHFRGSLSSLLNIISIEDKKKEILLIGNDFYGSSYFYEEELNSLGDYWKDFTYELVKKTGVHYSFQNVNRLKISDGFNFINKQLLASSNKIFCNNKKSLLVKNGCVKYKSINDFKKSSNDLAS